MRLLIKKRVSHAKHVFSKPKPFLSHLINVVALFSIAGETWGTGAAAEERLAVCVATLNARVARVGFTGVHVGAGASISCLTDGTRAAPVAVNHVDAAHA